MEFLVLFSSEVLGQSLQTEDFWPPSAAHLRLGTRVQCRNSPGSRCMTTQHGMFPEKSNSVIFISFLDAKI